MATKARKTVNLATAKTADAALQSPQSVYEMCGISTSTYRAKNLDEYSRQLRSMNLIDLQDEAYKQSVIAGSGRETLIDRLERKFIQDHARTPTAQVVMTADQASREATLKILGRGR